MKKTFRKILDFLGKQKVGLMINKTSTESSVEVEEKSSKADDRFQEIWYNKEDLESILHTHNEEKYSMKFLKIVVVIKINYQLLKLYQHMQIF